MLCKATLMDKLVLITYNSTHVFTNLLILSKLQLQFVISLHHLQSNCSLHSLKLLIRTFRVSLESVSVEFVLKIHNIKVAMYSIACICHIKITVNNTHP